MEILQCVLQSLMRHNVCYNHASNPNGAPTMRVTKRDALTCGLQANLCNSNKDPTMRVPKRGSLQ
eukprot:6200674-Pleurochrysis_carterae.AAC.1